jgi:hypothetical protein
MGSHEFALGVATMFKMGTRRLGSELRKLFGNPPARKCADVTRKTSIGGEDIVAVISGRIVLKRREHCYMARCPFHSDTASSLIVSPASQLFFCFGCRASGDGREFARLYDAEHYARAN